MVWFYYNLSSERAIERMGKDDNGIRDKEREREGGERKEHHE